MTLESQEISRADLKRLGRLQQRVDRDPNDHMAAYELAQLLWESGRGEEALAYSRRIVESPDVSPTLLEVIGKTLADRKCLRDALTCYERLAATQTNRALPHYFLGRLSEQLGDMDRAIK